VLGIALAAWVICSAAVELAERVRLFRGGIDETFRRALHLPRASYGMTLAHMGVAVSVAGISASSFAVENIQAVPVGGDVPISGYVLHLAGVDKIPGPNFTADAAAVEIRRDGVLIATVHPERRFFPLQQQTTSMTAIRTNFLADLYVALGDRDPGGAWTIRAYYKPLVPWIWIGAVIMAFGGMVSLSDRRWRVGVAARARGRMLAQAASGD
jgi:cytochrome c-type biogenesis protein CcmF